MKNFYGFHLKNSNLFVYGKNMQYCITYIDNAINSVEDICIYCQLHHLHIYCQPNRSLYGLADFLRVYMLGKKYSVYGSFKEFYPYLKTKI